jgi:hypothetical protein
MPPRRPASIQSSRLWRAVVKKLIAARFCRRGGTVTYASNNCESTTTDDAGKVIASVARDSSDKPRAKRAGSAPAIGSRVAGPKPAAVEPAAALRGCCLGLRPPPMCWLDMRRRQSWSAGCRRLGPSWPPALLHQPALDSRRWPLESGPGRVLHSERMHFAWCVVVAPAEAAVFALCDVAAADRQKRNKIYKCRHTLPGPKSRAPGSMKGVHCVRA